MYSVQFETRIAYYKGQKLSEYIKSERSEEIMWNVPVVLVFACFVSEIYIPPAPCWAYSGVNAKVTVIFLVYLGSFHSARAVAALAVTLVQFHTM